MALQTEASVPRSNISRKRKAHRKSRNGCNNCKMRGVKCDESRPSCNRCTSYGVCCNYESKNAEMQTTSASSLALKCPLEIHSFTSEAPKISTPMFLDAATELSTGIPLEVDRDILEHVGRFQSRTIPTIGTPATSRLYQQEIYKLAFKHPHLMHILLTLTAIHDRMASPTPEKSTDVELYHWAQSVKLFNNRLSSRINPEERDAIWGTAALLGVIAFAWVEGDGPEDFWPLKSSAGADLSWLTLCTGKMVVFNMVDPLRPDSVFHALRYDMDKLKPIVRPSNCALEALPKIFTQLYDLDAESTSNNPYHKAVYSLDPLLQLPCCHANVPRLFAFISQITPPFRQLLECKDARALVLLAYWYAKISQAQWWIARRATLECQSICIYISRHYPEEKLLQDALQYPISQCGRGSTHLGNTT